MENASREREETMAHFRKQKHNTQQLIQTLPLPGTMTLVLILKKRGMI
jgi:hypothetical protein